MNNVWWLAFDTEIIDDPARPIPSQVQVDLFKSLNPEYRFDIWDYYPFYVSIAAMICNGGCPVSYWTKCGEPMDLDKLEHYVDTLINMRNKGWKICAMNGAGFDFRLLAAQLPHRHVDIANLCLKSYDPCFQMLCQRGYPVGLEAAAGAIGAPPKLEEGADAIVLWRAGQCDRVRRYVEGDCITLAQIMEGIVKNRGLKWKPKSGGYSFEIFWKGPLTVEQSAVLPIPDTSWMEKSVDRMEVLSWI